MLRKFLIPTVVVSIFLLLTTFTSITTTEATSVTTSATTTTTATTDTKTTSTSKILATAQQQRQQFAETSAVNKFLNNAKETTTSLLPLQAPLNVTSTTLASFILNQKHQQQQQQQQRQQHEKQKQQRLVQVLEETQQFQEHLLNDNVNEKRETKKKNLDYAFVTVTSPIDIITPEPTSTHAYIPFDLDYNDPREEKALPEVGRQSTINQVLTNLFPKGFSDIFRFSYADDGDTTSSPATPAMTKLIRSTPTPFKPMPTSRPKTETTFQTPDKNTSNSTRESKNLTFVTMSTSVTKETRREISPGHTEIVVEKIITEPNANKVTDDFKDGSNSISKDELLRINRAAREASVLPSLLVKPQFNNSSSLPGPDNKSNLNQTIVILNDDNDDFVDAPEDDNQIAESQNVEHQLYQKVPPPESTNFQVKQNDNQKAESQNVEHQLYQKVPPPESTSYQVTQNHQYNVRIIHDDSLRKAQDEEMQQAQNQPQRHTPSYQSFVEQSKYLQNSLQEAPSRKFLKNFPQTPLSHDSNPSSVPKGNFHYEQSGAKNYIQTVPPAAQLQYLQYQKPQQPEQQALQYQPAQQQQEQQPQQQVQQYHLPQPQEQHPQQQHLVEQYHPPRQQEQQSQKQQLVEHYQPPKQQEHQYEHHGQQAEQYQQLPHPNPEQQQAEQYSHLHTQISDSEHLSDKDIYHIDNKEPPSGTPDNLIFVTINTPAPPTHETLKQLPTFSHDSLTAPSIPMKSPHEFVSDALQHSPAQPLNDHQTQETVDQPKPSNEGGYTFVEVQKSINIHNKLITEKDGRLIEQHETIYPENQYRDRLEPHTQQQHSQNDYVSLSQNPIHVEQVDDKYELAASHKEEQHAINPSQHLTEIGPIQQSNPSQHFTEIGPIQQSNLVQESHIIETSNNGGDQNHNYNQQLENQKELLQLDETFTQHQEYNHPTDHVLESNHEDNYHHEHQEYQHPIDHGLDSHHEDNYHHEEHSVGAEHPPEDHHNFPIPSQDPYQPPIQIPYALPLNDPQHHQEQHQQLPHYYPQQHQQPPMVYQEIIEKHIPMPYPVAEPVGVPVHIQHFIDRPYPVETIVEKRVPYPVETVVEKVVEKHVPVPVEVEKIVERPVEKIVNKYIDRPIAIPIKIPIALQIPSNYGHSSYGATPSYHPDHNTPYPHSGGGGGSSYVRLPTKVLQSYYAKMLKKLVPQMQQAYKNSALTTKPNSKPKVTPKPFKKLNYKISDILYDLKPPPARPRGSKWDAGARYQYDYNTLPLDMSASSSMDVGQQVDRPGQGYKTNFDEFQRWRNGHSLKRSPDFGRNLHMEYGFKPPLVPSVEIDDKGVPLKMVGDVMEGKEA